MALKRPSDDALFMEPPAKIHCSGYGEDIEAYSSSAYLNLLALIAECEGMRILRAEEEDGTEVKTHDFAIPAVFLKASDVLAPMVDKDESVLFSQDNVLTTLIPLHDSIADVTLLVDWFTRRPGFTLNETNLFPLTKIADKYDIRPLQEELKNFSFRLLDDVRRSNDAPHLRFDLWKLSACYGYDGLEQYLRKCCGRVIHEALMKECGLKQLLSEGVPADVLSDLVNEGSRAFLKQKR